jgi:hypothetical protein
LIVNFNVLLDFIERLFEYNDIKSIIRLTTFEFSSLLHSLSVMEKKGTRGPPKKFNLQMRLVLCLIYLKCGLSFRFLSWMFNISLDTVHYYILEVIDLLYNFFGIPSIPAKEERLKDGVEFYGKIVTLVIDGVEQEIVSSVDKKISKITFSGKKNYHTLTKLRKGKIYFVSRSFPGGMNDLNLLQLTENWKHLSVSDVELIFADDGFKGHGEYKIYTTNTTTSCSDTFGYKNEFKSIRVIVENVIG